MTRRSLPAQETGSSGPTDRVAQADSEPTEMDSNELGHLRQQSPWLRWTVYLCAAIGMTLAALMLLRPPAPTANLHSRPSACGPNCR